MMGQFQGILGNLQKGKRLPVGRGYAPPGGKANINRRSYKCLK
jgi:hypothetical protein